MDSLRFRFRKILVCCWWNALASAWFPASAILKIIHCGSNFALVYAIVHEKPRMNIRETWHNCPWQYFRSFDRGIGILSVSMAPDPFVDLHRGTSPIGSCWHVFSGRTALGLSFRECKRRTAQICPFSSEDNVSLTRGSRPRYCVF